MYNVVAINEELYDVVLFGDFCYVNMASEFIRREKEKAPKGYSFYIVEKHQVFDVPNAFIKDEFWRDWHRFIGKYKPGVKNRALRKQLQLDFLDTLPLGG